mgnify:CR=1 FL=1
MTSPYCNRPVRSLAEARAGSERRAAYREFLFGTYRPAMDALATLRKVNREILDGHAKSDNEAMLADIESNFRARLNELEERT